MKYAYYFEFCERPEMPEWFRGDLFLALAWVQNSFGLKAFLKTRVPEILAEVSPGQVIELGAGSGDSLVLISQNYLGRLKFTATDKYPHPALWKLKFKNNAALDYIEKPVGFEDFSSVLSTDDLKGCVLLMTAAFHHVNPVLAREFLVQAAQTQSHILIIEPLKRSFFGLILGLLAGAPALAFPVVARRVSLLQRLRLCLMCWVLPLIPLTLSHDGLVSALRQRKDEDWKVLLEGLPFELQNFKSFGIFGNFTAVLLKLPPLIAGPNRPRA